MLKQVYPSALAFGSWDSLDTRNDPSELAATFLLPAVRSNGDKFLCVPYCSYSTAFPQQSKYRNCRSGSEFIY